MVQQYHCGSAERAPLADKSRGAGLCAEICLHVLDALRWGRGKPNSAHQIPFPARRQVWVGRSSRECIMCWVVSVLLRWIALRKDSTIRRILGLIQPCFRIYRYLSAVCPRSSPINPVEVRLPTPCSTRQVLNLYDLDRTCQNHPVVVGVSVTPVVLLWRVGVDARRNLCVSIRTPFSHGTGYCFQWSSCCGEKGVRMDTHKFLRASTPTLQSRTTGVTLTPTTTG